MGVFNNYGDYNAKEKAERRAATMKDFLASDNNTHLIMTDKPAKPITEMDSAKVERQIVASSKLLTVKIENHKGFYSADCPNCGKTKILSSELNSLYAVCSKCYCPFLLVK